eukprot:957468-Amphidinium_carterae.1
MRKHELLTVATLIAVLGRVLIKLEYYQARVGEITFPARVATLDLVKRLRQEIQDGITWASLAAFEDNIAKASEQMT